MGKEWTIFYRGNRWIGKKPCRWQPMGASQFSLLTGNCRYVICGLPFRGWHIWRIYSKSWRLEDPGDRLLEERRRPNVKKVKISERSKVKNLAALDSKYLGDVMPVVEALAMLQYEDGSPRQPGYLGIWTQGSTWVVRITDKDADAQLTAEGRTPDEALDLLGLLLASEDASWEPIGRRKKKGG